MRPSCSSALVPAVFLILVMREEDFPIDPRRQYPPTARSAVAYYPAGCSPTSHLFTPAPLGSLEERVPPAQERLTAFVTLHWRGSPSDTSPRETQTRIKQAVQRSVTVVISYDEEQEHGQ